MQEVIPLIELLKDLLVVCNIISTLPLIPCKVFENNQSYIAVVGLKKLLVRTKYIAIKYYYFRSLVNKGTIKINYIDTKKQLVDILTNPIEANQFFNLTYILMGW